MKMTHIEVGEERKIERRGGGVLMDINICTLS